MVGGVHRAHRRRKARESLDYNLGFFSFPQFMPERWKIRILQIITVVVYNNDRFFFANIFQELIANRRPPTRCTTIKYV